MPYRDKEKQKKAQHESYLRNKNKIKERLKKRRKETRLFLYEYKLEHSCELCGEDHPATLSFHHIEKENKNGTVAKICNNGSIKPLLEEINKCKILCENCHKKIHFEFNINKRWNNIKNIKNKRLKKMEMIRKKIYEYKLKKGCKICNNKNPFMLVFHHKDATKKDYTVSDMIHKYYSENSIFKEIEKCDVLCSNCHRKYHNNNRH